MNSNASTHTRCIGDSDRDAARRALALNWPRLDQSSAKYQSLLDTLADFHSFCGTDTFELRYNLRPPKNRTEECTRQLMHEEITKSEFGARLKSDAERPIDLEMLTSFCDVYQERMVHYSAVLQKTMLSPGERNESAYRVNENEIDDHIASLRGKMPLWRENIETVFEFLEELRITSGRSLVKAGEFEGTSAHWLAQLVFTRIIESWRSCKKISERSHVDSRYLYAAEAIDLFYDQSFRTFPKPQSISERLREEFVLARAAIKRLKVSVAADISTTTANLDESIDNESLELVLLGDMISLVGQSNHIFRPISNSDWGIDGEIEFKDSDGQASGQRVYVQLKSGDSHLVSRKRDAREIFTVKNRRHLGYWGQQAYPVMLVIRQSTGLIRWMDISAYLKLNGSTSRQIIFQGEPVTVASIQMLAEKSLASP